MDSGETKSYINLLIKHIYNILHIFSTLSFWWLSQAAGSFQILPACVFTCVFGCCGGLSGTSICHGTIAHSSKRSAALMRVEGALLLLVDVVFGHIPIPAQTTLQRHSWWAADLSVCLAEPPPPKAPSPLIHHTTCSWQPHRRTAQLSCRKWGKKAWMLEHPVTSTCYHRFLSEDNAHIHSHTHPKECMHASKAKVATDNGTAFHFLLFISLWREKWALSLEPPEH